MIVLFCIFSTSFPSMHKQRRKKTGEMVFFIQNQNSHLRLTLDPSYKRAILLGVDASVDGRFPPSLFPPPG
jgi:hypothetical protein